MIDSKASFTNFVEPSVQREIRHPKLRNISVDFPVKYRKLLSKTLHCPYSLLRLVLFPSSAPILETVFTSKCRKSIEKIEEHSSW